jgi:hypothetical protein
MHCGSSILECRVYAKRTIKHDSFIGGITDMIESLLAEGASGGPCIFILASLSNKSLPSANCTNMIPARIYAKHKRSLNSRLLPFPRPLMRSD